MNNRVRVIVGIASMALAAGVGYAIRAAASGIPATGALTYSGLLEDANGAIGGAHTIQLILYDAATAGNNLCQSTGASINVVNGHFSVPLPDACTTAVGANPNVWVDVIVDGSDTGRTPIGAVPYAVEANHAVSANNATTATNAVNATNATNATNAVNAMTAATATSAVSAGTATNATTATTAGNATNATNATNASRAANAGLSAGLELLQAVSPPTGPCAVNIGTSVDCTCPAGTWVVSGGAFVNAGEGAFIRESRPVNTTSWRVTCANATSDVLCNTSFVLCSRISP